MGAEAHHGAGVSSYAAENPTMLFPRKGGETMRILCADAGSEVLPVFFYYVSLLSTYYF